MHTLRAVIVSLLAGISSSACTTLADRGLYLVEGTWDAIATARSVCIREAFDERSASDLQPLLAASLGMREDCADPASLQIRFQIEYLPNAHDALSPGRPVPWAALAAQAASGRSLAHWIGAHDVPSAEAIEGFAAALRRLQSRSAADGVR